MARSLTVKHDEKPATSPLFTGFLLISIGWLMLSAFAGFAAELGPESPSDTPAGILVE
ncbi:MAG: hypothetical protein HN348_10320 [Proteobacteria bacterium]|jgi:hypothetical protein|nr:hypothetical protein [Pseudomonadota bacterium]